MKKLLGIMAASALAVSAFAQGTVQFQNQTGTVKQWTASNNTTLISVPKSSGYIELIAAPTGTPLPNPLGVLGSSGFTTSYSTLSSFLAANPGWAVALSGSGTAQNPGLIATGPGLFSYGALTINNIAEGAQAEYIAIAWTGTSTTLDTGISQGAFIGESAIFTTATGDPLASPPGAPANTKTIFGGMTLAPQVTAIVPEPTSFALMGLGAAALMIFRRRK